MDTDLGPAGRALWTAHVADYDWRVDELALLQQAAKVADQVAALESALEDQPTMIEGSKGQVVIHPLIAELRFQRGLLASLLGRLNVPEGEPGAWDELNASQRARRAARARWDNEGGR